MDATDTETTLPRRPSYHWTPALQREFLEHLAATGSVRTAAMHVSMSPSAAYQLRHRPEGAAFRLGWAAAVLIARERLADELLDRAIWGYEETATISREDGRSFARRQRRDSRLGLAMLARLDQMVEVRARAGEAMAAQVIAGDWPGFLALFDAAQAQFDAARAAAASPDTSPTDTSPAGESADALSETATGAAPSAAVPGQGAALAVWLAGRDNRANPLATLWAGSAIASEVARISANFDAGLPADLGSRCNAQPTVAEAVGAMGVWRDGETGEWRTDFPPPADFTGIEDGEFGEARYERTLDPDEEMAWEAARAADAAPLRHAAEAARRACFGLPAPANDPDDHDADADAAAAPRAAAGG